MTEKTTYVGRCRAAGRKHGLRRDQSCGEPVLPTHGLFCRKHYDRIKRQVRAGKAAWEDFERGFRRVSKAKPPGGRIRASRRPYIHELKPKSSSVEPVSRSAERGQSPKVRKKLRALKQRLDPNGVPGTYSEGLLESTTPHTLRFPEIHSCIWLHQDGVVLRGAPRAKAEHAPGGLVWNFGPCVPVGFWDKEIEPSPQPAVRTEKPLPPLTPDMRLCRTCCRWAARTHCTVCDEELIQRRSVSEVAV
jgi:hypothetical protein